VIELDLEMIVYEIEHFVVLKFRAGEAEGSKNTDETDAESRRFILDVAARVIMTAASICEDIEQTQFPAAAVYHRSVGV
jgi:hypothetical protein